MASLEGQTIASTYKQLLKITSEGVGADASTKYIEDGLGTDTALSLSTTRVGIGTASPTHTMVVKTDSSGTVNAFKIEEKDSTDALVHASFANSHDEGSIGVYYGGNLKNYFRGNGASYITGGSFGVGTSSVNSNATLHVRGGDSGQTSSSNNTHLTIEGSGNTGIQLLTGTTNVGGFWIGDSNGAETGGKLYYSNNDDGWQFYNAGSTNSLNITSAGNVLIGTTDNDARLMVKKVDGTAYGQFVTIEGDTTDNNNYSGISFKAGTLANAYPEIGVTNGGLAYQISGGYHSSNYNNRTRILLQGSDGSIQFMTGGDPATEVGRFDSLGNFGIGASGSNLNARIVRGFSANKGLVIETAQPAIQFVDTADTSKYFTQAYDNGDMYFYNSASGFIKFSTSGTERMLITSEGEFVNVVNRGGLIGTFKNDHSSIPYGIKIDFDSATPNNTTQYFITCQDSTNDKFVVSSNGDVESRSNSFGGFSDERLKENIVDATPKLDELNQVRVVNYNFKDEPDKKQLGVIGQELQEIFPKMVSEYGEDGYLGVKYSIFVPMLIKALQEADDKIDALTARIEALENA
jgi:hypothetical protein